MPKVIWNLFAQSHANFLSTGWVEDGFCTQGTYDDVYYDDCMQDMFQLIFQHKQSL